jgi:hypothetical protein
MSEQADKRIEIAGQGPYPEKTDWVGRVFTTRTRTTMGWQHPADPPPVRRGRCTEELYCSGSAQKGFVNSGPIIFENVVEQAGLGLGTH